MSTYPQITPTKEELEQSLKLMFDAFIRDEISEEYPHRTRIQVLEAYRFFEKVVNDATEKGLVG